MMVTLIVPPAWADVPEVEQRMNNKKNSSHGKEHLRSYCHRC